MSAHDKPLVTSIFLDVDEVLADWIGPALRLLGYVPSEVYARWDTLTPRPWDVFDVVPRPPSCDGVTDLIDAAGASFWADLPTYPWALELYNTCQLFGPTTLLTSPSKHASSHAGKFDWMQRVFGRGFRNYFMGSVKYRVAHPGALLIDDSPKNCESFRAHGGHAILFPGVGNDLHHIPGDERVAYVREQLKGYRRA